MNGLMQDLRYALRSLRRRPGFFAVAVLTLALGIGANTAIFSVVDAVLLRPLPYPSPDELVQILSLNEGDEWTVSPPDFVDWRRENAVFTDMAAFNPRSYALTGSGPAVRVTGAVVTSSLIPMLGGTLALGTPFTSGHEVPGNHHVVILSDALWRTRFGADAAIVGRTIQLDGEAYSVLGVMPRDFASPGDVELWTPLAFTEDDLTTQRGAHYLTVIARLPPDAPVGRAASILERMAAAIAAEYPRSSAGWSATAVGLREAIVGDVRRALATLLGAVALVLLIACANVANLQLVRAVGRDRELAVRSGLVVAETALAVILVIAAGLAGAVLLTRFLRGLVFGVGTMNPLALLAAGGTLAAVAVLASYVPARRATRVDPMEALRYE